ncbi:MAG TPA: sigma factor, partial [Actinomycetota bacterium]|nr:sigma factor [Actinomycetota bacterium]
MQEPGSAVSDRRAASEPSIRPVSFEAFFEAEHERLFRALYLVTGNAQEAEELMQDAFVAVWERWDRVSGMDDPTGYLFRTAMNRFRSRLRRASRAARRAVGPDPGGDA